MINLSRGTLGWVLKDAVELSEQIEIWAITFDDYNIPNEHLFELWKRARDLRIVRLQNGLECPDFTAELLTSSWTGANGLKAELEERRIKAGRSLSEYAESQCPKCFGSKMEIVKGKGARPCPNCDPAGFEVWRQKYG